MTRTKKTPKRERYLVKLTERMCIGLSAEWAADIDRAAARLCMSRADFMRHVAVTAARNLSN